MDVVASFGGVGHWRVDCAASAGALSDVNAKAYPIAPSSAEHQRCERLKKRKADLSKLPKRCGLLSGLLDYLNIKRFEDVASEDLPVHSMHFDLDIALRSFSKISIFVSLCFVSGITTATDRQIGNPISGLSHLFSR